MTGMAEVPRRAGALAPAHPTPPAPASRVHGPRPWAAPLPRPAARILLAGGLTVAGWLLGAALSHSTASADELPAPSGDATVTAAHPAAKRAHGEHRSSPSTTDSPRQESGSGKSDTTRSVSSHATVTAQRNSVEAPVPPPPAAPTTPVPVATAPPTTTPASHSPRVTEPEPGAPGPAVREDPAAAAPEADGSEPEDTPSVQSRQGPGLLGGLVGGLVGIVRDTLGGVVGTLTGTTGAVLAPPALMPPSCPSGPIARPPLGDILDPVFSGGGTSGSGEVVAIKPDLRLTVPGVPLPLAPQPVPAPAPVSSATPAAVPSKHPAPLTPAPQASEWHPATPETAPAAPDRPRDHGTHARTDGGGGGGGGLPGTPNAPVLAPSAGVSTSHDNSGARQPLAVHPHEATVTQLRLIGVSRDHAADGAGREAALPATSPD
ncbi:hypothetical protein [Amycolatopsis samaneae]|uniref:Uncharacterized protein n=1 Tax=Amycolatopsis samaneae TaxID=664691 RepID=A0ABW5GHA0_9PSEU